MSELVGQCIEFSPRDLPAFEQQHYPVAEFGGGLFELQPDGVERVGRPRREIAPIAQQPDELLQR